MTRFADIPSPALPNLTLVLGGSGSGKSEFAERMALQSGRQVLYVATAAPVDAEMAERIELHRERRPAAWRTLEVQGEVVAGIAAERRAGELVLLEDMSMAVATAVSAAGDGSNGSSLRAGRQRAEALANELCGLQGPMIVVSSEVGMGLVPLSPIGRSFVDALGLANQMVAARADAVFLLAAGLPIQLKPRA